MPDPSPQDPPGGSDPRDALSRLEQRLDAASQAAERLLGDAARQAARRVPAMGWQAPAADGDCGQDDPAGPFGADADLLLGLLATLRDRIPPELAQRLADAVREVLLAIRALIDWYLQRTESRRRETADVQDIPIL